MSYKIIRHYFHDREYPAETVKRGLTLDEAQAHCRDPETSSNTCKLPINRVRTERRGPWFDGYLEEKK